MGELIADISISLDGYVAGPDPSLDDPLGVGGEGLREWAFAARSWREAHGREGGEENDDSGVIEEAIARAGATIMGRKMFSGGSGPWAEDPRANGWWGDEPPFGHPVFVLTHHEREPLELTGTTFTFVTDGIESALDQARVAAGEKDVLVAGGADAMPAVSGRRARRRAPAPRCPGPSRRRRAAARSRRPGARARAGAGDLLTRGHASALPGGLRSEAPHAPH